MERKILITASIFGLISVILGAFASHGLKNIIDRESIEIFQIGVRYQMYHALFLLGVGCIARGKISESVRRWVWISATAGIILFSGSIYGLSTNAVSSFFDFKKIGFITPIGGLLLMISWLLLLISIIKEKK